MSPRGRVASRIAAAVGGVTLGAGVLVGAAGPAFATSAQAKLTGGTLSFVSAPPALSWSGTLNGKSQVLTTTEALDISDATGTAAGWHITLTSTTFANGAAGLSASAAGVPGGSGGTPSVACDSGAASCTTASNAVSYPYTVPAGTSAPTATAVYSAAKGTGIGNQTVTVPFDVAVSASATAGTYTSTWTFSLISGP